MADTPLPGVTPPESRPQVAGRAGDEDLVIDVAGFARLLWRFRFAILIATVTGGALGVAYARSLPPRFLGSSVLNLTLAPGTGPGAEELARFQALVRDPAIIAQALSEAGLPDLAPDAVASVVTTKVAPPGTLLLVEAQWPDAETAGRLPSALARRAKVVLEEQRQKDDAEKLAALQQNWVEAEQQVQRASAAFVEEWLRRRIESSRIDPAARQELEIVLQELPPQRAQLLAASRTAGSTTASAAEVTAASTLMKRTLLRVIELEARRDLLVRKMSSDRPPQEIVAVWSDFDARQKQLELELFTAREASVDAQKALATAKEEASRSVGMELIELSMAPGRRVGLALTAFLARGLASGFLFSVFAVFFFNGMARNFFGRRI